MPFFRMDKWYADLLTEDYHYLFLYCTALRMAGTSQTRLSLVSSRPGECRTATYETAVLSHACDAERSVIATRHGGIRFCGTEGVAWFEFADMGLSLRFTDLVYAGCDPLVIEAAGGSLRWFPCALRARVTGTVTLQGVTTSVSGASGYADHVHSHILPPLAPVRTLVWGRFHTAGPSFTYSLLERPSGGFVGKLFVQESGRSWSSEEVKLHWHEVSETSRLGFAIPSGYDLEAGSLEGKIRVAVTHGRPAVSSEFVDAEAVRNPVERALYRWFGRNPRGVKFLSRATLESSIPGISGVPAPVTGISEYVVFGRR